MNGSAAVIGSESHRTLCQELSHLIVRVANLKHTTPEQIDPEQNLYRDGLGLDSIDLLEVVVNVERKFGLKLRNDEQGQQALRNVSSLATAILNHREVTARS
jgi:acyl carrier protein